MSSTSHPSSSTSLSSSSNNRINTTSNRQASVSKPGSASRVAGAPSRSNSTRSLANPNSASNSNMRNSNSQLNSSQASNGKSGNGNSHHQKSQQQQQQQRREEDELAGGGNIQVVVRVRGRAPGEAPSTSSILSTSGPRGSQIHVATDPTPVSSSSIQPSLALDSANPSPNEKTYSFDSVFGPEADQGMVYQSVVGPVLKEVMSGYNCTIFAYGQTGTGKTHTMEGNLTPNTGTYHSEAGIIPRTLYRLFHTLEGQAKDSEYAVRASFVELYNEELRDLLSPDVPQSSNSNGYVRDGPPGGLKMYEDSKGKGVVIQGLEETPMRDAEDGLNLLRRGSQKRQIAATRCNENSSRSHSVFTLTIHIKETSSKGEDILRIGKLNLVDLAGSENIGRSGAENKRAREAGMINQSLLTLGRVINALVEKNAHVPYRESKLTRLLQESLGGRTKTCIIATVSEDKTNFEETLSTLDYALRAKSIRNRPEMNTRMTRTALIKEYVHEIERLKSDLLASRSQTGIFLSDENWRTTQEDIELNRATAEKLRREKEVVESRFSSLEEQFEQSTQLLGKRENECLIARKAFDEKAEELKTIIWKIDGLEKEEEEQRSLKEAYQQSEKRLGKLAEQLRDTAVQSTSDVGGLFAKLERKTNVETSNRQVVAECQVSLASMTSTLDSRIQTFGSIQSQFASNLTSSVQSFADRQSTELNSKISNLTERLSILSSTAAALSGSQSTAKNNAHSLATEIDQARENLLSTTHERTSSLREACSVLAREVVKANGVQLEEVKKCFSGMAELMGNTLRSVEIHVNTENERIQETSDFIRSSNEKQIQSLKKQNEILNEMLLCERERSKIETEEIGSNIMKMLMNSSKERDDRVTSAIEKVQESLINESEVISQNCLEGHENRINHSIENRKKFLDEHVGLEKKSRKYRKKGDNTAALVNEKLGQDMEIFGKKFEKTISEEEEDCRRYTEDVGSRMDGLREQSDAAYEIQNSELRRLVAGTQEGFGSIEAGLHSTKEEIINAMTEVLETANNHQSTSNSFIEEATNHLSNIQSSADSLSTRFAQDVSTGETPIKKDYNIRQSWNLVPKEKEAILARARARRRAGKEGGKGVGEIVEQDGGSNGLEDDLEGGSVIEKGSEIGSIAESEDEDELIDEENNQDQELEIEVENYDDTLDDTFADATIDASPMETDRITLTQGPNLNPRMSLASRGSTASAANIGIGNSLGTRSRQVSTRQVSSSLNPSSISRITRAGSSEEVANPTSSTVASSSSSSSTNRSTKSRIASNALKEGDPNVKRRSSDDLSSLSNNVNSKNKNGGINNKGVNNPLGLGLPASKRMKQ